MIGFNYTYLTLDEIFKNIQYIQNFSVNEYIILAIIIIFTIITILYLIPGILILNDYLKEKREKINRKNTIRQIAIQKEIQDEIEKEMEEGSQ